MGRLKQYCVNYFVWTIFKPNQKMSAWNNLISHPHFDRVKTIYNDHFPIEVRFVCAHWIEERIKTDLNTIDINHPQIKEIATDFLCALIQQLINEKQNFKRPEKLSIQHRLDAAINTYRTHLLSSFAVYKQIRDTVAYEERLLGNFCENQLTSGVDEEAIEIIRKLNILRNDVLTIKEKQTNYKHEIENYKCVEYKETMTLMIELNNPLEEERRLVVLDDYQRIKFQYIETITTRSFDLNQCIANVISQIDSVQKLLIVNRLNKWHRGQALAGNGSSLNRNLLDEIQLWFEKLAEIIWTTRCCIEATREINNSISFQTGDVIEQAHKDVTRLLINLIESGFIVENQPPQVLKTDFNFTATVRLLTANLGNQLNNTSVVVSYFTESLCSNKSQTREILNNTGKLEMQASTHHLSCTFNNMKLKKFKRTGKKELPFVTDKKYALIFESTFRTADITINVSAKTLPLVIVVHTYQEPQSWATILWDNAFSEIHRQPFHVTDTVSWSHLTSALNMKFTAETNKSLTPDSIKYLYEKLFETNYNDEDRPITWTQLCRTPLPGRKFTFWEWFYSVMKLVKNHVQEAWTDGFIIGFIDKQQTIEKLQHCEVGTFLVRFSESELGGISIAWVGRSLPKSVVMLQPIFSEDFKVRSLADRIKDVAQCITLYPDIPKDLAFKRRYSPVIKSNGGYVRSVLITSIPDLDSNIHNCCCQKDLLQLVLDLHGDPAESFDFLSCS